jgi:serine/threonine-protein kinase
MGTPAYMSPEQARGAKDVGPPATLYAVGTVLYEALVGAPVFRGDSYNEVLAKVLTEPHTPLAELRPGLPSAVIAAVDKLLSKSVADRPADALQAQSPAGGGLRERRRGARSGAGRAAAGASSSPGFAPTLPRTPRPSRPSSLQPPPSGSEGAPQPAPPPAPTPAAAPLPTPVLGPAATTGQATPTPAASAPGPVAASPAVAPAALAGRRRWQQPPPGPPGRRARAGAAQEEPGSGDNVSGLRDFLGFEGLRPAALRRRPSKRRPGSGDVTVSKRLGAARLTSSRSTWASPGT